MLRFKQLSTKHISAGNILFWVAGLAVIFSGAVVSAQTIGVGVGTGKIELNEPVKPNLSYDLPPVAVFNNGDVKSDYEITVEYNEVQDELKPEKKWFNFSPKDFELEPGKAKTVNIVLAPEFSAKPGKYFAYIEAHPIKKDQTGTTSIQVAAATKLYFEVKPANIFMRIFYALQAFWSKYHTWIIIAITAISLAIIVQMVKKHLNISVQRKTAEPQPVANEAPQQKTRDPKKTAKNKKKPAKKTKSKKS